MLTKNNSPAVRAPDRRVLRVFAFDPMQARLSGKHLSISIPFETDLAPGPDGELVQVIDYDAERDLWYQPVDLDDPLLLAQDGLRPSESDPRSHQQIVYAIAMSVIERFERFTGRRFRWFGDRRLRIVPHAFYGRNAYFDPQRGVDPAFAGGAVLFGYYRADSTSTEANLPGQLMFTCLSVDVVAHEVTHAIVNRVRRYFTIATNPDVYAFHEAFADLVALFHHFLFPEVVAAAVAKSKSNLEGADALFELAKEFGHSTGRGGPLRRAIDPETDLTTCSSTTEPHERGAIFVAAIFDAYLETYKSRIADLRQLATNGSGILGDGELSPDLVNRIAKEATKNADRVLGMVVRAFDYMPVVDVTFGDVVQAIVTADRDLFPDDAIRLRGHMVEALRKRGIFPPDVVSLADQALIWRKPAVDSLSLSSGVDLSLLLLDSTLKLDQSTQSGEAAGNASDDRRRSVFTEIGAWATANAHALGLDPDGPPIESVGIHAMFTIGSDGQPHPRIVAQVAQRRMDLEIGDDPDARPPMYAGTTIIAGVDGLVIYVIPKPLPLTHPERLDEVADDVRDFAVEQNEEGARRLDAIRDWFEDVDQKDPLAAWLTEPGVSRLSFAHLHAAVSEGVDDDDDDDA